MNESNSLYIIIIIKGNKIQPTNPVRKFMSEIIINK